MSLGSNIKKRRFQLHLTQQELADLMGYKSRATIAKIESGENSVSHAKLLKFARVLDTTYASLTSGTDTANYESDYETFKDTAEPDRIDNEQCRNVAVILAGGKSIRNYQNIPNQFIEIMGKPVVIYCLEAYQQHPSIDDIYIVCLKGWEEILRAYAKQFEITKLRGLIPGGATGIESVKTAFDSIRKNYKEDDVIVFQESTRPMVTVDMISRLLQSCKINKSATICESMKDHVQFMIGEYRADYINRDHIVDLQSPEAHTFERLRRVFEKAKEERHELQESCCTLLMYNLGFKINFIEGSINNIKIVHQEDVAVATALLKTRIQ